MDKNITPRPQKEIIAALMALRKRQAEREKRMDSKMKMMEQQVDTA